MRVFFILTLFSSVASICFPQDVSKNKSPRVKLLKWSAEACDNTYDPYRLQNRITRLELKDGITSITVNFTDNCCADFKPGIEFKANKLTLLPYREYSGDYCSCDCCFSINFEIQGIESKNFEVYFKNKKIEVSGDHYKTIEPTYVVHEGRKINQINRYGFKEGTWIEFYDDGSQKNITRYPEQALYREPDYEWSKRYFENGDLSFYNRSDTTESWFQDGELKSQTIRYSLKDTTFEKRFAKYENKQLQEKFLERHYPTVFKSEFDSANDRTGSRWDYVYKEEYHLNGQLKYLQRKDTSFTWYETGRVKYKSYNNGKLEYNEQGQLINKSFHWKEPGLNGWGDLNYSLYIDYYENGDIQEIHFVRDEPSKNGKSLAPGVHYYWRWDSTTNLIESPKNWKEDYPWKKFNEVGQSLTKHKLH